MDYVLQVPTAGAWQTQTSPKVAPLYEGMRLRFTHVIMVGKAKFTVNYAEVYPIPWFLEALWHIPFTTILSDLSHASIVRKKKARSTPPSLRWTRWLLLSRRTAQLHRTVCAYCTVYCWTSVVVGCWCRLLHTVLLRHLCIVLLPTSDESTTPVFSL